ncbi:hypothetical protein [Bradyrhizobium sp. B120]|uniref:hypothetical protein n=1 Tax=Bradyrhizobium sp. B120 TaxID=3410088 RepID=UPI003B9853FB
MKRLVPVAAVVLVILAGADFVAAAELPTYEVMGLPITALQVSVLGSAHVREVSPIPTLTLGDMPASPHQIAVMTARHNRVGELAGKPSTGTGKCE